METLNNDIHNIVHMPSAENKGLPPLVAHCVDALKRLGGSPTFAMSRGAKELFHTNFLAFVLELDVEELPEHEREPVKQVQLALLKLLFGPTPPETVMVWREAQSLDLVVLQMPKIDGDKWWLGDIVLDRTLKQAGNHRQSTRPLGVILETKLKALPDAQQLERYNQKLEGGVWLEFPDAISAAEVDLSPSKEPTREWGAVSIQVHPKVSGTAADRSSKSGYVWAYPSPVSLPQGGEAGVGRNTGEKPPPNGRVAGQRGNLARVLLAPGQRSEAAEETGWRHVSWESLIECFKPLQGTQHGKEGISYLLRDYATSTGDLLSILRHVSSDVYEGFCGGKGSLGALYQSVGHDSFAHMRLHDVTGKYAYSVLLHQLRKRHDLPKPPPCFVFYGEVFMTRGIPGINLEFRKYPTEKRSGPVVRLGVQIQGSVYRHYVSASPAAKGSSTTLDDIARHLSRSSWWKLPPDPALDRTNPFDGRWNVFGADSFLYTKFDAAALTYAQLCAAVCSSMGLAATELLNETLRGLIDRRLRSQ